MELPGNLATSVRVFSDQIQLKNSDILSFEDNWHQLHGRKAKIEVFNMSQQDFSIAYKVWIEPINEVEEDESRTKMDDSGIGSQIECEEKENTVEEMDTKLGDSEECY